MSRSYGISPIIECSVPLLMAVYPDLIKSACICFRMEFTSYI